MKLLQLHLLVGIFNSGLLAMDLKSIFLRYGIANLTSGKHDLRHVGSSFVIPSLGNRKGEPWYASVLSWVFGQAGFAQPRKAWSASLFPKSRRVKSPAAATVFGIYFADKGRIAHAGLVERVQGSWLYTIEGNTNTAGLREGDGVYRKLRHARTIKAYADWTERKGGYRMRMLPYLWAGLVCSCSAKQKLTESSSSKLQQSAEMQGLQTQKSVAQSYQLSWDSSGHSTWVKLYPKEVFVLDERGFVGKADSLVWFGYSQQLRKQQQWQEERQDQSHSYKVKQSEVQQVKEQKKEVVKAGTPLWWWIGCGIGMGVCFSFIAAGGSFHKP